MVCMLNNSDFDFGFRFLNFSFCFHYRYRINKALSSRETSTNVVARLVSLRKANKELIASIILGVRLSATWFTKAALAMVFRNWVATLNMLD